MATLEDTLNQISPTFIGEDKITVQVAQTSLPLDVSKAIILQFTYGLTGTAGVVLPLILQVQPAFGDGTGYFTKTFNRSRPNQFTFRVNSAGQYLVLLREFSHNNWQGRLLIDVAGESFSQIQISERI